jgi:hypothetical protein
MTLDPNTIQNLTFFTGGIIIAAYVGLREDIKKTKKFLALKELTAELMIAYANERTQATALINEQTRIMSVLMDQIKELKRQLKT